MAAYNPPNGGSNAQAIDIQAFPFFFFDGVASDFFLFFDDGEAFGFFFFSEGAAAATSMFFFSKGAAAASRVFFPRKMSVSTLLDCSDALQSLHNMMYPTGTS